METSKRKENRKKETSRKNKDLKWSRTLNQKKRKRTKRKEMRVSWIKKRVV